MGADKMSPSRMWIAWIAMAITAITFSIISSLFMAILEGAVAFFIAGLSILLEGIGRFEDAVKRVGEYRFNEFMIEYKEAEIKYEKDPDRVRKLNHLYADKYPSTEEPKTLLRTTELGSLSTIIFFGAVIALDAFTPANNYLAQQTAYGFEVILFVFGILFLILTGFGLYQLIQIRRKWIEIQPRHVNR